MSDNGPEVDPPEPAEPQPPEVVVEPEAPSQADDLSDPGATEDIPEPEVTPEPEPDPAPEIEPQPDPEPDAEPDVDPDPQPEIAPQPTPEPESAPEPVTAAADGATPIWMRRPWQIGAGVAALLLILVIWLVGSLPLGQALEPLENPTLVLVAADGRPIAKRGSYKEEPVEVAKLPKYVSGAFIAIEDRRFYLSLIHIDAADRRG